MKATFKVSCTLFILLSLALLCSCSEVALASNNTDISSAYTPSTSASSDTPSLKTTSPATVSATPTPTTSPTPTLPPVTPTPIPYQYQSYENWLKWREENPEEYKKWLETDFPQKEVHEEYILEWTISDGGFRYKSYVSDIYNSFWKLWYEDDYDYSRVLQTYTNVNSLPSAWYLVRDLGLPKEELLDLCKWWNSVPEGDGRVARSSLSVAAVELLYSDDYDAIRRELGASYTYVYGNKIYTMNEIVEQADRYDIGRIFTKESLQAYVDSILNRSESRLPFEYNESELNNLINSWDSVRKEYERINASDAGVLKTDVALERLGTFFELYEGYRYSPEKWSTGKAYNTHYTESPLSNGRAVQFEYAREDFGIYLPIQLMNQCLTSDLPWDLFQGSISFGGQFYILEENTTAQAISADPIFYTGAVRPYTDTYTLQDHMTITENSDNAATVVITALSRDGSSELTYTVEFQKEDGKWRISGGNILDLIASVE